MSNDLTKHSIEQMNQYRLSLRLLEDCYSVCRLLPSQQIPAWAMGSEWFSITKTSEELSIVCRNEDIPQGIIREMDWRIIKIEGPLDFGMTGVLSAISTVLANEGISIFAVSTYNTDYILVKEDTVRAAIQALGLHSYEILGCI